MEKLYSLSRAGGRSLLKFSTPPKELITNELSAKPGCKFDFYRKHWVLPQDDQFIAELERTLVGAGYQRVATVEAQKAPLKVAVSTDGASTALKFNRKPDDAVVKALGGLAVRDAGDKTKWFVSAGEGRDKQVLNALSKFPAVEVTGRNVLKADAPREGQDNPVTFIVEGDAATITFLKGVPADAKLDQLRGALQMLGYAIQSQ
jgi:hypothetical protein